MSRKKDDDAGGMYREPLLVIQATYNEVIALGAVMTSYVRWVRSVPRPTEEQVAITELLRSFHDRLVASLPPTEQEKKGVVHT